MAVAAQPKPQWITFFVVGAFLAVAAGVGAFVGPTVIDCAEGEASFGGCLQRGLAESGIIPMPKIAEPSIEVAAIDPKTAADEAGPETTIAVQTVKEETATQSTTSGEASDADEDASQVPSGRTASDPEAGASDALTFGLRAEPDGSILVAGSGKPGEKVQVFANGELLGETDIMATGDWLLLPDAPLAPGGTEISVSRSNQAAITDKSIVVVIQEDRTSEPLVFASTPGEAMQIIQGATASSQALEAVESVPASDQTAQSGSASSIEALPETQGAPDEEQKSEPDAVPDIEVAAVDPAPQLPADSNSDAISNLTATPEIAQDAPDTATPDVQPTIDAIEVDGNRNFFAGGGKEDAVVRLYVNDKYVADAIVASGRWLVETNENLLTNQSQRVRIDMLRKGSGDVAARAEVNFDFIQENTPQENTSSQVADVEQPAAAVQPDIADEPTEAASAEVTAETLVDPDDAINMAAANNTSDQLAAPPEMPTVAPAPIEVASVEPVAPEQVVADIDAEQAINSAASTNASNQIAGPPAMPVEAPDTSATAMVEPEALEPTDVTPNPEAAINAAAANNTASQLATPPAMPVEVPAPIETAMTTPKTPEIMASAPNPEAEMNSAASNSAANQLPARPEMPVIASEPAAIASAEQSQTAPAVKVAEPELPSVEEPTTAAPVAKVAETPAETAIVETEQAVETDLVPLEPVAVPSLAEGPRLPANQQQPATVESVESETASPPDLNAEQAVENVEGSAPKMDATPEAKTEMSSLTSQIAEGNSEQAEVAPNDIAQNDAPVTGSNAEVPTLVASETADGRFVSGQAIIRRGDNLWTIARRVYGQGIRYAAIYQANQRQIRDPNLIYPGQVFQLPDETSQ